MPDSPEEEETPTLEGTRNWLPPRQSPNETLPEFRIRPHQHCPTLDEQSLFRPPVAERRSARIPVLRVIPNNIYGDRPPIDIERDLQ